MAIAEERDPPHDALPGLGRLQAATLYLMSRYARDASPQSARSVVHHLEMLRAHPHTRAVDWALSACDVLLEQWRRIAEQSRRSPDDVPPPGERH